MPRSYDALNAWLENCRAWRALQSNPTAAQLWEQEQRVWNDVAEQLWQACLASGWTAQELDDAHERAFGERLEKREG